MRSELGRAWRRQRFAANIGKMVAIRLPSTFHRSSLPPAPQPSDLPSGPPPTLPRSISHRPTLSLVKFTAVLPRQHPRVLRAFCYLFPGAPCPTCFYPRPRNSPKSYVRSLDPSASTYFKIAPFIGP